VMSYRSAGALMSAPTATSRPDAAE
jgi:hypothetical protein